MSEDGAATNSPVEVMFYHLERQALSQVLPMLLEKTLERGWRAVVQAGSEERLEAIDSALWTFADDSFLAHGTAKAGHSDWQPIYLTVGDETPNGAGVRFMIDGAVSSGFDGDMAGIQRFVFVFDGHDSDAVAAAREQWKAAKSAGCKLTYWQQSEDGRWERKA